MTHRIVVGACGLVGSVLAQHFSRMDGDLLSVDTGMSGRAPEANILRIDCRDGEFADQVRVFVTGADRFELYHAAGSVPSLVRIGDLGLGGFRATIEDNLVTTYAAMRAVAEAAAAASVTGSITVLGSVGAAKAHRYKAAYDAAKAGAEALVRCFAVEYGPERISCRTVALGPIAESPSTAADGDQLDALVRLVPLQQYPTVAEVVRAIAAVGSPAFDAANGHVITLDGGLSQQLRPIDAERRP